MAFSFNSGFEKFVLSVLTTATQFVQEQKNLRLNKILTYTTLVCIIQYAIGLQLTHTTLFICPIFSIKLFVGL